jgi:hypothetical protein
MQPARAYVPAGGRWTRLVARVIEPPQWASSLFAWSLSAAFAAGLLHMLAYLGNHGSLLELRMKGSLGVLALSVIFVLALFLPLLISAGLYLALISHRTPRNGAVWCVGVHTAAHIAVMIFLAKPLTCHLVVPLFVAGLWGLWLPRVGNPEGYPYAAGKISE